MFRSGPSRAGRAKSGSVHSLTGFEAVLVRIGTQTARYEGHIPQGRVAAPVVFGRTLYFCNMREGAAYALDMPTGVILWRFSPDEASYYGEQVMFAYPALDGGAMFLGTTKRACAVELATGALRWSSDVPVERALVAGDGRVFLAGMDGAVHALDAASGKELWRREIGPGFTAAPALAGSHVFAATERQAVAIDSTTGEASWRHDLPAAEHANARPPLDVAVAASEGRVLVVHDFTLRALRAETGEPLWSFGAGEVCTAAALDGERAYAGTTTTHVLDAAEATEPRHALVALDVASGAVAWREDLADTPAFGPVLAGGVVYLTEELQQHNETSPFRVVARDARTGKKLWQNGDFWMSSEPVIAHDAVLWGTSKGSVKAIR
jgi:outer membrane protein assembly factor BamB